jgi:Trypsin
LAEASTLAYFAAGSNTQKSFIILIPVGLECIISGWGLINVTTPLYPDKLQYLQVRIAAWNDCRRERPHTFHLYHICAGTGVLNKATCMVINFFQNSFQITRLPKCSDVSL